MHLARRHLLRAALPATTLSVALAAGLLRPGATWAWNPPRASTSGRESGELLRALRGAQAVPTHAIRILAPDIAEDGASVFLAITAFLPGVDGLAVFVDRNPQPLSAVFWFAPEVLPDLQLRVKMALSGNVWVVARSQGQFHKASKAVTVTVGGCGVGQN